MKNRSMIVCACMLMISIQTHAQMSQFSLDTASEKVSHLYGKPENSKYPYVTAGDRLYAIGNQAGNFPEIGFHIPGEMGGIWQHPIKLMDGYRTQISSENGFKMSLNQSDKFVTYPFVTKHIYTSKKEGLLITRTQFVPDGVPVLVVEYSLKNKANTEKIYDLNFFADVDLRPVWLGEKNGMIDSTDFLYKRVLEKNTYVFKDHKNNWFTTISSNTNLHFDKNQKSSFRGKGTTGIFNLSVIIPKGGTQNVRFYIGGSVKSYNDALDNSTFVKRNLKELFLKKEKRYAEMENIATLDIPDKKLQKAWRWGKYSSDWLIRDVPGLGRGMGAGLPDYPWFFSNDQAYTFNALVGTVKPQLFYDSWSMLKNISNKVNNGSGRVIHEASTNGVVYDKGRMEESQLHIETAWNIFKWTGNKNFLKRNYQFSKRTLSWLMENDKDNDLFVEGYGGAEIEGMNNEMLDVAVHTQRLLYTMAQMAKVFNEEELQADYQKNADILKDKINSIWWVDSENRYADFIGDKKQALELIDRAIKENTDIDRNKWALTKLKNLKSEIQNKQYKDKGYVVYYTTAGILPLKEGIADTSKAKRVLEHISYFANKYGLYIEGIERPDDITQDEGSVYSRNEENFNYDRAVMPAATSSLAIAESRYGSASKALQYVHKILNSFSYATPGTTYEVSPDYGMFVQAWNITGIYIPIVQYFFGINPLAHKKEITIIPEFPEDWKYANLENLIIGNNRFSINYKKENENIFYKFKNTDPDWTIKFQAPTAESVWVNGTLYKNKKPITLTGRNNEIKLKLPR